MNEQEELELGNKPYANITSNANNIIKTNDYIKFVGMVIKELEEVQKYRAIGTVEECRAAVEKQKSKKVIKWADGTEHCPTCDFDNSCIGYGVCIDCGQKLDWSEEE